MKNVNLTREHKRDSSGKGLKVRNTALPIKQKLVALPVLNKYMNRHSP